MREALGRAFEAIARDNAVRAVLLTGAGRAFCASGDVCSMGEFTPAPGATGSSWRTAWCARWPTSRSRSSPRCAGPVAGIGWSLALACDMIVASETARFLQSFRHVGLVPDGGAIYFLTQHLGVLRAKELVYTGRRSTPPRRWRWASSTA